MRQQNKIGYHIKEITKGVYGDSSKVIEEMEELLDAIDQYSTLLALVELSDLYGAGVAIYGNFSNTYTIISNTYDDLVMFLDDYRSNPNLENFLDFFWGAYNYLTYYHINLDDIKSFSKITERVFKNGIR